MWLIKCILSIFNFIAIAGLSVPLAADSVLPQNNEVTAPLRASVTWHAKLRPEDVMKIFTDFKSYGEWAFPKPEQVIVDNIGRDDGRIGVGSLISFTPGSIDEVIAYDEGKQLVTKPVWPQWRVELLGDQQRVVYIESDGNGGSRVYFRHYFESQNLVGFSAERAVPYMMKISLDNLAEQYGGEVREF